MSRGSSKRDAWQNANGPILTDEECEKLAKRVTTLAERETVIALMWLWANRDNQDWRKRW